MSKDFVDDFSYLRECLDPRQPRVKFTFGDENQSLEVSKQLVCEASPLFRRAFSPPTGAGLSITAQTQTMFINEDDVEQMLSGITFLYSRSLESIQSRRGSQMEELAKIWIFAHKWQWLALRNEAMDAFVQVLRDAVHVFERCKAAYGPRNPSNASSSSSTVSDFTLDRFSDVSVSVSVHIESDTDSSFGGVTEKHLSKQLKSSAALIFQQCPRGSPLYRLMNRLVARDFDESELFQVRLQRLWPGHAVEDVLFLIGALSTIGGEPIQQFVKGISSVEYHA